MAYMIKNIGTNKVIQSNCSKGDIIRFFLHDSHYFISAWSWKPLASCDKNRLFRSLSMTDKDMKLSESCYHVNVTYFIPQAPEKRLFRVYDETGRICDPRFWDDEINAVIHDQDPMGTKAYFENSFMRSNGSKNHYHRVQSSAMRRQNLRMTEDRREVLDDDVIEILHDRTAVRDRGLRAKYKDKFLTRSRSKSWKDQHHSESQWNKHNSCSGRRMTKYSLLDDPALEDDILEDIDFPDSMAE